MCCVHLQTESRPTYSPWIFISRLFGHAGMHQSMAPPPPATTTTASYATASTQHLATGKTSTATNNASNTSSNQIEQSARGSGIQPHANAIATTAASNSCSSSDYASYFGHCSTPSASVDAPPSTVVSAMHGEHLQQQCNGPTNKTQQSVRIQ